MAEGQAPAQPELFRGSEMDLALSAANRILDSEVAPAPVIPPVEAPAAEPALTPVVEPAHVEVPPASEPQAASAPEKIRLKVKREDGGDEEVEVDIDGLKRGFMMERDYRAKTAQLAEMRRQEEAKVKSAIEPKLREYEEKLNTFSAIIQNTAASELAELTPQLAQSDPSRYVALVARRDELQSRFMQVQQEQQRINEQRQAEAAQQRSRKIQEANEQLADPIRGVPDWNPQTYEKILNEGAAHYEFKRDELNAITDPRVIRVLHDANQWRALKAAKPIVEKRVAEVPKVIRPGTVPEPQARARSADWDKGMARLKQSGGSERAAVELAKQLIGDV